MSQKIKLIVDVKNKKGENKLTTIDIIDRKDLKMETEDTIKWIKEESLVKEQVNTGEYTIHTSTTGVNNVL